MTPAMAASQAFEHLHKLELYGSFKIKKEGKIGYSTIISEYSPLIFDGYAFNIAKNDTKYGTKVYYSVVWRYNDILVQLISKSNDSTDSALKCNRIIPCKKFFFFNSERVEEILRYSPNEEFPSIIDDFINIFSTGLKKMFDQVQREEQKALREAVRLKKEREYLLLNVSDAAISQTASKLNNCSLSLPKN